jgi:hypothetical protein
MPVPARSLLACCVLLVGCVRHVGPARPAPSPMGATVTSTDEPEAEPAAPEDPPEPDGPPEPQQPPVADDPTVSASFRAPVTFPAPSPATRMAKLSPSACSKELAARSLPFSRSKQAAAGVASGLRPSGALHGVRIVIPRAPSLFGVLDCRAALALADMAEVAAAHDVVELQVDNAYRPKAHLPGKKSKSQHAYGLALDVTRMKLRDGTELNVERDWHAPIGSVSCGPDARMDDPTPASIALRDVVCAIARRGIFHHILSPSWDAAHRNHLHLDIARNASRQAMH